jgi:hypothetical protein
VATTGNINPAAGGLLVIDGITVEPSDRVLLKDQADQRQNGIYGASAGEWYRASDGRSPRSINKGTTVHVQEGTANGGKVYAFQTLDPVIGTDDIQISFYISDDIVAGAEDDIQQAADEATAAMEAASEAMQEAAAEAEADIDQAAAEAIANVEQEGNEQVDRVEAAGAAITGIVSPIIIAENTFGTKGSVELWNPETPPDYVRTAGHWTAGDGGGALYRKVGVEPSHEGKIQSADGTWWELAEPAVYPEMFGARGDGATNDVAAITSAIAFCNHVRLRPGVTYAVNSTVLISGKTSFRLEGNGATIKRTYGTSAQFVHLFQSENVHISDIYLFGDVEAHGGLEAPDHNLACFACKRVLLENVHSSYAVCDGFYFNEWTGVKTQQLTMINCTSEYNYRGAMSLISVENALFENCKFNYTGLSTAGGTSPIHGVDLEPNVGGIALPLFITFRGCEFRDNASGLIINVNSRNVVVENCLVADNRSYGISNSGMKTVVRSTTFLRNGSIANQRPQLNCQWAMSGSRTSMVLESCLFYNGVWRDIQFSEGAGMDIRNCLFEGGTNSGIVMLASGTTAALRGAIRIRDCLIAGLTEVSGASSYISLGNTALLVDVDGVELNQNITRECDTVNASTAVTQVNSCWGLNVGMGVTGTNIPLGATIASIDADMNSFVLSAPATATGNNSTLTFASPAPVTTGFQLGSSSTRVRVERLHIRGAGWVNATQNFGRVHRVANNMVDDVITDGINYQTEAVLDPVSLADGAGFTTTVAVSCNLGDFVDVAFSLSLQGITVTAWVSANDVVSVRFQNETGGVLDLASGTLYVMVRKRNT